MNTRLCRPSYVFASLLLLVSMLVTAPWSVAAQPNARENLQPSGAATDKALLFVQNIGQFDGDARFLLLNGPGLTWLVEDSLWITVLDLEPLASEVRGWRGRGSQLAPDAKAIKGANLRLSFVGANPRPRLEPFDRLDTSISYLLGDDPAGWYRNVPSWGGVRYVGLYPGVDLVITADQSSAESSILPWHLEVRNDAALGAVALRIEGAETVRTNRKGLSMTTSVGEVNIPLLELADFAASPALSKESELQPAVLQEIAPRTYQLTSPFAPAGAPLLSTSSASGRDLVYSTFLGGGSWDMGDSIAVDGDRAAYVAGTTPSSDFPFTPGAFDTTVNGLDAFVAKVNEQGTSLLYATFLGGSAFERGHGLAVESGLAYVTGYTESTDFPLAGGTEHGEKDVFVAVLNQNGTDLLYSTLVGGSDDDYGYGVAVEWGSAYVTGSTSSSDFPASGYGGNMDAYVAKVDSSGELDYATFLGGSQEDAGFGIAVSGGNAYITGETYSPDFPDGSYEGGGDGFVAKLNATGGLSYSTLLGGSGRDTGNGIAVDGGGAAYVVGTTESADFPTTAGTYGGSGDAFLAILNSTGSRSYGSYLGGTGSDKGQGAAVDSLGGINLVGLTESANFPTTDDAYQPTLGGSTDVFVTRVHLESAEPGHLTYSTFLGGSGDDEAYAIALDGIGDAYLTGYTQSANFPTSVDAFDTSLGGARDSFVAKLMVGPARSIDLEKHTNGEDADQEPGPYVLADDPVTWTYTVTNTGEVELTNVTVTDDPLGEVRTITALGPGATDVWAEEGIAVTGQYSNTGTVTGTPPGGLPDVSDSDSSHYFGAQTEIQIEKYTNGQDSDNAPGVYIVGGEYITWTYVVSNTGNVTLTDVTVEDNRSVIISCLKTWLAPDEATTCEAAGMAGAGQYSNTGTATGTPPGGLADVSDNDSSHYFGIYPSVDLKKYTNGQDVDSEPGVYIPVGDPVTWTYLITNTGNITLTDVLVSDDQGVEVTCGQDTLAPDETMTCTAAGTAELGQYSNLGSVTGWPPVGPDVGASDPSFYFGVEPSLDLEKYTDGQDADAAPGPYVAATELVTWTYVLTNTGNVTLTEVTVSDDQGVEIACPPGATLAPDESMTCTASGAAIVGQYSNLATAAASPPGGLAQVGDTDPSHYFGMSPSIIIEKYTDGQEGDSPPGAYIPVGDPVTWTYAITNTGNVTLTNITVEDSQPGLSVSCPETTLGPGESVSCTASGTAEVGQYGNLGSVSGTPPVGPQVTANDPSHYFGAEASVDVEKYTRGEDADTSPGPYIVATELVTWTYVVTNTGNVALTNIQVADDQLGWVCEIASLEPEQSQDCLEFGIAGAGQYTNTATAAGTPPGGLADVSDSDPSHYFGIYPSVDIEKHTNGQDADSAVGAYIPVDDPVIWTYAITNTGNITLTNVTVEDSQPGLSVSCPDSELAEKESMSCSATGTAELGQYGNVGSVSATPPIGPDVGDSDPSFYFGAQTSIDIEKYTNDVDADEPPGLYLQVGDAVIWTYVVTNTGNITLTNVIISDDQGVEITCPQDTLAPQESITCTAGGTAQPDQYVNQGTASGKPVGGLADLVAVDLSHYFGINPSITIEKYTNDYDADQPPGPEILIGQPVTWTYVLTNTGNVPLEGIAVEDSQPGLTISCPQTTLAVDESITCSAYGTAAADQYANVGTVTAHHGATMAGDGDPSHYFGASPEIDTKKYVSIDGGASWQDADQPPGPEVFTADELYFKIWVKNTGNVELVRSEITLQDGDIHLGSCVVPDSLAPGYHFECVIGPFDVVVGQQSNTSVVSVAYTDDCGNVATPIADDTAHYLGIETFYAYLPLVLKRRLW